MLKEVKIELTNMCLRNCKHCSSSATNNKKNLMQLNIDTVKKVLYEAKSMGVNEIVFTGGEPLAYDGLDELIELTSKLKMSSSIYTFAYRNEENLKKYKSLVNKGLGKIVYSLADTLSNEKDYSSIDLITFFDNVIGISNCRLGFHYAVSKDSINSMKSTCLKTIGMFKDRRYFDKISLLRFVPHGKGNTEMDLSKNELLSIKELYLCLNDKSKLRLGSPWNIFGIENSPCVIADEIMIIGFDGIAYPCDSIKYFNKLGTSGNISESTIEELYNSEYFKNIRKYNIENNCSSCTNYGICKSGCIGQKIIANYTEENDKELVLKRCINSKDPKCMR